MIPKLMTSFSLKLTCIFAMLMNASSAVGPVLTKYDHFAKHISNAAISVGGRLQEREIAYIASAGYHSILSVVEFNTTDTSFKNMPGNWPSSEEEKLIAESYGMQMKYFASTLTVESVDRASALILSLPKPIYVHCHVGWTASLFTQLHLIRSGAFGADYIYNTSLSLGYDYQSNTDAVALIEAYTGVSAVVMPEQIEQSLVSGEMSYKNYYWVHRFGASDLWYNAGQILDTHVVNIAGQGYKSVISFRANGEPTVRLPTDPQTGPVDNHEFSDVNGNWDAGAEERAFASTGITFYNLPVSGSSGYSLENYRKFVPVMQEAAGRGPVLSHCASGFRAAVYVSAFLAAEIGECTAWALKQSKRVGYIFDDDTNTNANIVEFFGNILGC